MASTDFILPGRRNDNIPFFKASLGKAFANSRATNPRNVEYPWYGYWSQILVDLTSEYRRLIVIPQHLLYYTSEEDTSKEDISEEDITVDDPDTSIPSVITTPQPHAHEIVPDFAIIRIILRWRDPEAPKKWRNIKIRHAGVPLLVEIKRAGSRAATSLEETLVHMAIAQNEAMLQAAYLFRMIPVQQSVMLMACTGRWWSCRIVTREEIENLEDEIDAEFNPDENELDEDSDDEIDNDDGIGNELTGNDLNQLEDEAEDAQDGGEEDEFYLEPIVDEAELELPTSEWTKAMRLESRASKQKMFLIHRRLGEVVEDDTRTMG